MFSTKRWILLFLLLTHFIVFSRVSVRDACASPITWIIETVDASADVGVHNSIAIDSDGFPHIAYYDNYWKDLKYATPSRVGPIWFIATVDTVGYVGLDPCIALDSSNSPHISYFDYEPNYDLKYARDTPGGWSIETVDGPDYVGAGSSLALDVANNPHISYIDGSNSGSNDLKYAWWTGSAWNFESIETGSDNDIHVTSLALDANDRPHVSYSDYVNNYAHKYAQWTGTAWSIETFDAENYAPMELSNSLALDADGHPHISYINWDEDDPVLNYARWTGSAWSVETIDTNSVWETSLALDTDDHPHISYIADDELKYARWTGSAWSVEVVDTESTFGFETSLALDAEDKPHISYYDRDNGNLKYASTSNEFFRDVNITPYDSDSDGLNDSVHIEMNVDTMDVSGVFDGSVPVEVNAFLVDSFGYHADYNTTSWSVTDYVVDWQKMNLSVPFGYVDGPSMYAVEMSLFDEDGFYEDFHLETALYLYPASTRPTSAAIMSCTESREPLDEFMVDTFVFMTGNGFSPSTGFDVYVVEDQESWVDEMVIPARMEGTEARIESNATGDIRPTVVWDPQVVGAFDVVIDVNGNGYYDEDVDALDDADIDETAGFVVLSGDASALEISVLSPENTTYTTSVVALSIIVDGTSAWMGYSLDDQMNVTMTGNTQLTELADGSHHLTVYVEDMSGHMWVSNQIHFTIDTAQSSFIQTDLVIFIMLGAVVGGLVLVYLIKR